MPYRQFERATTIAGVVAGVVLVVTATATEQLHVVSISVQLMLLGVLIAAVKWGRRGGSVAALLATIIYFLMQAWAIGELHRLSAPSFYLVMPMLIFGLVGIGFGHVLMRLKYRLSRYHGGAATDDWSHLYHEGYFMWLVERAAGSHGGNDGSGCIVVFELPASLFLGLKPARRRSTDRIIGAHLVDNIRMSDDASRLKDGRFAVLLGGMSPDRARKTAERLVASLSRVTGAPAASIRSTVICADESADSYAAFMHSLTHAEVA